ncbi:MAG TPA: hypothetical protein VEZ15_05120 [Acidimicrobiia bacterium]|nr:hypothetical protein [Acidimicrobiia bacterium]
MWWWTDAGVTAFRALELIGALWLLIVAAVLAVDHLLHGRKDRASLHGRDEINVPARPTRAPEVVGRAA